MQQHSVLERGLANLQSSVWKLQLVLRTNPSAPTLPLPVTRKVTSISQYSNMDLLFVQTDPLWLFNEGVILI